MEKKLGKISSVKFGLGGYQDAMLGLSLSFDFNGSGCGTNLSFWDFETIECTEHCKWTEEEREEQAISVLRKISELLKQCKISDVNKLLGKPVECTFKDFNTLDSWRILTEVI